MALNPMPAAAQSATGPLPPLHLPGSAHQAKTQFGYGYPGSNVFAPAVPTVKAKKGKGHGLR
jgi:hypothetical protein